ncbi:serine/threonine-protein kinase Tor-like [Culex pipiens pallens]|uniref:serine/threonine-protein kinase Tor-like n=1 Tax=Culex pipiens pallens TaxID=42434 RepID=UPI001954A74B|nr:serine/threonine-protein kinase Tor-like [Culex pipiens pallens]
MDGSPRETKQMMMNMFVFAKLLWLKSPSTDDWLERRSIGLGDRFPLNLAILGGHIDA